MEVTGSIFKFKYITEDEYNEEKKEYELRNDKVNYLASRFASKEAYFKATQDIHYLGISILNDKNGKELPYFN